ncbi:hypothetical protein KKHFBJBL_02502 [Brevundimonas sp. NIBR11]|nr:hypothetical protein KKHFBJBL_02502 [Brevundimonas sp. NIBR11]
MSETVRRGERQPAAGGFEEARPGTIYWTLSLYIEADKVVGALQRTDGSPLGERIDPEIFRRMQQNHWPSLALASAIDPLMNDIADRESQGVVKEFLLAATNEPTSNLREGRAAARKHEIIAFRMPASMTWTTEGVQFEASPPNLADDREVRLRRFWLAHNNGALSYHMSFSHYYGSYDKGETKDVPGHDPSTYYFLSLLQKLAAPKEYALRPGDLKTGRTVFDDDLGIDPLDNIKVAFRSEKGSRFWPFVKTVFEEDAAVLFARLSQELTANGKLPVEVAKGRSFTESLIDLAPFIEVPGLTAPKSRFMFMLHDEQFFGRLMPFDHDSREPLSRKAMVRDECYAPYEARIRDLVKNAEDAGRPVVSLDETYWQWVCERPDYLESLKDDELRLPEGSDDEKGGVGSSGDPAPWDAEKIAEATAALVSAMRAGLCVQTHALDDRLNSRSKSDRKLPAPVRPHIPAFEANRADCLDYLFLAGFNQNIIDFMNQDTSEILDSTDPLYPDSSDQTEERFFVRYANHRAMITYVRRSRSLETGNDYIGACPYAFLIHATALHNEFLARDHEQKTMTRIERIQALIAGKVPDDTAAMRALESQEPLGEGDGRVPVDTPINQDKWRNLPEEERLRRAEIAINQAKLAKFSRYDLHRQANPFRYDTERVVFGKLEELRGVSRKNEALVLAIASLEDHARDLARRQQRRLDAAEATRGQELSVLLGMTGVFGAGQMFYWIGEKTLGETLSQEPRRLVDPVTWATELTWANFILTLTEVMMTLSLGLFVATLVWVFCKTQVRWLRDRLFKPWKAPTSRSS